MENLSSFYQDIRPSLSADGHLTQEEPAKEALQKSAKSLLYYRKLEGKVNKNALADTGSDINTMPYRILFDIRKRRDEEESDSDDEDEYQIKRNKFEAPIYGPKPSPYLNFSFLGSLPVPLKQVNWKPDYKGCYTKEEEATRQWHTEIKLTDPYGNIYIQDDDEVRSSRSKRSRKHETMKEVLLLQVHHEFLLWEGCSGEAKSSYNTRLANLLPRHIYSPCLVNWDVLNRMGCDEEIDDMLRIRLREARSDEEIFTSVAWIKSFNINEPIYTELCHEFYSTYEFNEVCTDDELQTKKIIKFRLCGRALSLTLLEFSRRLGQYQATRLNEEGFNVYFEGGLRSDEHFNAQEYWLRISQEKTLSLSRSHASTIKYPVLRVIHKMIIYGLHQNGYANVAWLIARWMKRKRAGTQKKSQICHGQFISKIARKSRVLTDNVLRSLSAPVYCRDLDTTTLRELIDSESRLILEDPQPGVPRLSIPRPPRASM
uniref:Uncharacterized protein n=1 Tax=Tanacetum cinerariifolium TaxID=118510 RepID=A0A6L2N939_TANCI|nr:hypothetical protein [Tanacetum cinerariifolium]